MLLALTLGGSLAAQTSPTAKPKISDSQRAVDDALDRLFYEAGQLRLTTGQTLDDLLARSAGDERSVRLAIAERHQVWRTNRQTRGEFELDTWMPISKISDVLGRIVQQRLKDRSIQTPFAVSWARSTPPAVLATGRYLPATGATAAQAGWRHCTTWQIDMARAAAAVDAQAAMLERLAHCRVGENGLLGFLLQRDSRFRAALAQRLRQVKLSEAVLEPAGICRVCATLDQTEIPGLLLQAAEETDGRIRPEMVRLSEASTASAPASLTADGFSVAPPVPSMFAPPSRRSPEAPRPEWADRFLVIQGTGKAPADVGDEVAKRTWAERAARIEANRYLWMQIEDLPLSDNETIASRLSNTPKATSLLTNIDKFITAAGSPMQAEDGTVTVSLGIHLYTVWRTVSILDEAR